MKGGVERREEGALEDNPAGVFPVPKQLRFDIQGPTGEMGETARYYEFDFIEADGNKIFNSKMLSIGYAFYWAPDENLSR